jgi:murein DD-endopeptidase MepM/ murein hydrolase activator NlpD
MLFRKYHIMVFKDGQGQCRRFSFRPFWFAFFFVLLIALGAGNVYLWKFYESHSTYARQLEVAEKTVQEQKTQLLSLASKIKTVEKDLYRISDFDAKLRVMINLDQGSNTTMNPVGGPDGKDFSRDYLTVYRQELLARKMHNFLRQLSTEARLEEIRQQELMQIIQNKQEMLATTPSIWPCEGWVTSNFGYRTSPFTGKREFHKGLDIAGPNMTPIYSPAGGKVSFVGRDGSYGLAVKVDHGNGMATYYAHLHKAAVEKGKKVSRAELIGYMGSTGRSTGPHLHYEVRLNGVPVDPQKYILN